MSLLADYYVLLDGNITPSLATTGAFADLALPLPTNFTQSSAHIPVLTFRLDTGTPNNLMFRVLTSKSAPTPPAASLVTAFTATFNSDVFHSLHEVININNLSGGVTNTIRFERLGGSGALDISDIVLWYKRNVTSANLTINP